MMIFIKQNRITDMKRTMQQIKKDIEEQLAWDIRVNESSISIDVKDHTVLLNGTVESFLERQAVENDAWIIPGVSKVDNNLTIKQHYQKTPSDDEEIKWNIVCTFTLNSQIDETCIDVSVSNSVVMLNGSVNQFWKKLYIEEVVFQVPGVIEVINAFSVVPESKTYDKKIASDIIDALERIGDINIEKVNVEVNQGQVTLKGSVPDWHAYSEAHNAAKHSRGVIDLINKLIISH